MPQFQFQSPAAVTTSSPQSSKLRLDWSGPQVNHRGARLFNSGNALTDFLTRWAAGSLLSKPNLTNTYNMLSPRRPMTLRAPDLSQYSAAPVMQGPPVGLLARLAYMNPGMAPMLNAAGQTILQPNVVNQLSPETSQLLRYL